MPETSLKLSHELRLFYHISRIMLQAFPYRLLNSKAWRVSLQLALQTQGKKTPGNLVEPNTVGFFRKPLNF